MGTNGDTPTIARQSAEQEQGGRRPVTSTYESLTDESPLNDPNYAPLFPPTPHGEVPASLERWKPASQVRWFVRYSQQLRPRKHSEWEQWWCESVEHKGKCCISCIQDKEQGYGDDIDTCCCRAIR